MSIDRSVEPLSATMTSPSPPSRRNAWKALSMQTPTVRSSLRQGITADSRIFITLECVEPSSGRFEISVEEIEDGRLGVPAVVRARQPMLGTWVHHDLEWFAKILQPAIQLRAVQEQD